MSHDDSAKQDRLRLPLNPEEALRALLAVKPDDDTDRDDEGDTPTK